jgi:hypothetical protein
LEQSDNAVTEHLSGLVLLLISDPRVLASSNPGLKLANAFGVFKLNQYYLTQRV